MRQGKSPKADGNTEESTTFGASGHLLSPFTSCILSLRFRFSDIETRFLLSRSLSTQAELLVPPLKRLGIHCLISSI